MFNSFNSSFILIIGWFNIYIIKPPNRSTSISELIISELLILILFPIIKGPSSVNNFSISIDSSLPESNSLSKSLICLISSALVWHELNSSS